MHLLYSPLNEKIYIPPRLTAQLNYLFQYPLTVITSPSGTGKTTAVGEFLKKTTQEATIHWYTSFGEAPDKAWNRICSIFSEFDKDTADALKMIGYPVKDTLSEIAETIQDMVCNTTTVVVIDNFQLISGDIPSEVIAALSQHSCTNLHIVIITQNLQDESSIPFHIPRVLKLDSKNFFYKESEIAAYFRCHGFKLTKAEIKQVAENTSGWIAAIRLQLLSCQQTGEIHKEVGIDGLLKSIVWDHLTEKEKNLLILLSPFEGISRRQICIVLGVEQLPQYALNLLDHRIFISFDSASHKFIVHHLMRKFLTDRKNELTKKQQRYVDKQAGQAYLYNSEYYLALQSFYLAGDYNAMLKVPISNADLISYTGFEIDDLLSGILQSCPRKTLLKRPKTLLIFAFEAFLRQKTDIFEAYCNIIEEALNNPKLREKDMRYLRGELSFLRSTVHFNDVQKTNNYFLAALKDLGGPSTIFNFNHLWTYGSPSVLYFFWTKPGELKKTIRYLDKCMPSYTALTSGHGTGVPVLIRAEAALLAGRLGNAEALAHKSLYLSNAGRQDSLCLGAELILGRIAILQSDIESYSNCLANIQNRVLTGSENGRHLVADQCRSFLSLLLDDTKNIPDWLTSPSEIEKRVYGGIDSFSMTIYGKFLLLKKNYNELFGLSELVLHRENSSKLQLNKVYYQIYLACAKNDLGKYSAAQYHLLEALDIALPDRIYMPFAEHGEQLYRLFNRLQLQNQDTQKQKQILQIQLLINKFKNSKEAMQEAMEDTENVLTEREQEIARLVKKGLTNKEIAEILFVTPETVKMALKKIFCKLHINSRYQVADKIS